MSDSNTNSARAWPDYRAVWRWHFYASLFCIPFVIVLSITGAIYLFKPQIDAWGDRKFDGLKVTEPRALVSQQVQAAMEAVPGSIPVGYEMPQSPSHASRVLIAKGEQTLRVYVHPSTLEVLHTRDDRDTLIRQVRSFHGQLGLGDRGSNLVELAASWTFIMLATGLYLWWPRSIKGWGGVIYPRLTKSSNIFWRDLHSVTGIWITGFAVFLLATGLPWAKFWGNYFRTIRAVTGTAVVQQDWTVGSEKAESAKGGEHGEHGEKPKPEGRRRRGGGPAKMPSDMTAFDRVVATVTPLDLAYPVLVSPPRGDGNLWSVKSDAQNRTLRTTLSINGDSGEVITREDFKDRHWVDQFVGIGIAAHEGQLFGWPNQLLGLITAIGLIALSLSGYLMWWRRRDQGVLGAPKRLLDPRISYGLIAVVLLLALYLPLFGISLAIVLLVERLCLTRMPRVSGWLGLCVLLLITGCGQVKPVEPGTSGTLTMAGEPMAEMEVTVYRMNGDQAELMGKSTVGWDGQFAFVSPTADQAVWLQPGSYRFTLESVGSPLAVPSIYRDPRQTPLKYECIDSKVPIRLEIAERWSNG